MIRASLLVLGFLSLPLTIRVAEAAQQPSPTTIRVETDLVEIPVTVTNQKGQAIIGLTAQDFKIYEDGVEQRLHHFTSAAGPVSWGLVLDRSGSMAMMMEDVYAAAIHMVEAASGESEALILTFNNITQLMLPFTSDRARMRAAVTGLVPGGRTALWDAVELGLDEMRKARYSRKALVVVTDGEDNMSATDPKRLIERVKESDVLVYSVAMGKNEGRPFWMSGGRSSSVLRTLAEASGAYAHSPRSVEQCQRDMQRIASEVSHQYILGYYPTDTSGPAGFRKLSVRVETPRGSRSPVVRAREGYFGPRPRP